MNKARLLRPAAAPGVSEPYTTNSTDVTYYLNTTRSNFTYAENMCMRNGGHLASFTSAAEQLEVEEYYRDMGYLFPSYHVFYWSGLMVRGGLVLPACGAPLLEAGCARTAHRCRPSCTWPHATLPQVNTSSATWPSFSWSDITVPKPRPATFINWGTGEPGSGDGCGGGNYSLVQADGSWGWADANCNNTYIYMCRITREQLSCMQLLLRTSPLLAVAPRLLPACMCCHYAMAEDMLVRFQRPPT